MSVKFQVAQMNTVEGNFGDPEIGLEYHGAEHATAEDAYTALIGIRRDLIKKKKGPGDKPKRQRTSYLIEYGDFIIIPKGMDG